MLFFLSFFLQRFAGGVTGISVSRTSIVLSSTVKSGESKIMSYEIMSIRTTFHRFVI
jgi:hypothetical protein